jgi:ribonuclease HI
VTRSRRSRRTITYQFDGSGSHNFWPAGWGWAAFENGEEIACGSGPLPPGTTRRVAEYTGLIMALKYALAHDWGSASQHIIFGDSLVVINQVKGVSEARDDDLVLLCDKAQMLLEPLKCELRWHERKHNKRANMLASEGRTRWRRVWIPLSTAQRARLAHMSAQPTENV